MDCSRFLDLPEGCISEILSLTSPEDAARFSAVSRTFNSAAKSDAVWEKFLPSDYQQIISRSDTLLISPSKKQLYLTLCNSPILLDDAKLSFSLHNKTGKKCFMVAAKELGIAWGDSPQHWEWLSDPDSRFSQVAKLNWVCWFDIRGKLETQILSKRTRYIAYLVFKLEDYFYGLENAKAVVRFVDSESDDEAEERASVVRFSGRGPEAMLPLRRGDGWRELKMGTFFNDTGENGVVDARLMEIRHLGSKGGLIVQGVEFRPE